MTLCRVKFFAFIALGFGFATSTKRMRFFSNSLILYLSIPKLLNFAETSCLQKKGGVAVLSWVSAILKIPFVCGPVRPPSPSVSPANNRVFVQQRFVSHSSSLSFRECFQDGLLQFLFKFLVCFFHLIPHLPESFRYSKKTSYNNPLTPAPATILAGTFLAINRQPLYWSVHFWP